MTLQQFLTIELPIIQAPMAGVQDSALAAAVCNAGGLGSLPCAMLSPEALDHELSTLVSLSDKPYNVNFFCHTLPEPDDDKELSWRAELGPYFKELKIDPNTISLAPQRMPFSEQAAGILAKYQPAVVSFHFGLPSKALLARVKNWGAKVLSTATTVEEALWLQANGADAIIAQGLEAGGHRGNFLVSNMSTQSGTFALLPQIVTAVKIPVIAAGGIANSAGVKAALSLGAAGVQVGTSYLLCPESKTSAFHRAALASKDASHTVITNLFSGRFARSIVNRIIREKGPVNEFAPPFPTAGTAIAALRAEAEALGLNDFTQLWCGQNATGCKEIPAAELTRLLASDL